jgi:hypothetical protein
MIKHSIFYLCLVLGLFSCTANEQGDNNLNPSQLKVKNFEKEVLAIYDEVMPLMGDLVILSEKLEEENKLLSVSQEVQASDQVILNDLVISKLDGAHKAIIRWMQNYRPVDTKQDPYAKLQYLEEQKYIIGLIRDAVHEAIRSGNNSLNNGKDVN